jgi:hypothetical protein
MERQALRRREVKRSLAATSLAFPAIFSDTIALFKGKQNGSCVAKQFAKPLAAV